MTAWETATSFIPPVAAFLKKLRSLCARPEPSGAEVEEAVDAAKSAPDPGDDELQTDVFADPAALPA